MSYRVVYTLAPNCCYAVQCVATGQCVAYWSTRTAANRHVASLGKVGV